MDRVAGGGFGVSQTISRRSLLACAGAASAQLLFSGRVHAAGILANKGREIAASEAAGILAGEESASLAGVPGAIDLSLTAMTANTLRIGIAPVTAAAPEQELGVVDSAWSAPLEHLIAARSHTVSWGNYSVRIESSPLTVTVLENEKTRQQIRFEDFSTNIHFPLDGPVFGLGEGTNSFDRRGTREGLENGQVAPDYRTFGARVQIPWVISPAGWGVFVGQPQGSFEFTQSEAVFRGVEATSTRNVFLLLGEGPADVLKEYARLTGFPHMPPRWALGYLQSHRTLASHDEVLSVLKTFREKKLPCDAVIYLGTGFCPSGWNTGHGSFIFNEQVFPDPPAAIKQIHDEHFKVILHVVPPGDFHGSVSDTGSAAQSPGDAATYWEKHAALERIGIDGWWPDEGDKFSVYARFDRNRMYFEGSRKVSPDRRPFALHRNGYAGLQRYGWLWSGDTSCTWRTLRAQIMVGIGAALSGITYWGTDIGGFVPTPEFTPELYLRWFQWAAFCPLFRGHGRAWHLRLPWGWNTGDPGPKEVDGDWVATWPPAADLHRPDVEEICRKYLNLRYQLLPYLYSSVAQGHATGLPLMRALSIHWPQDEKAAATDDAYMWGDNFLVAPVYEKSATERSVYLPAGTWWDYWTGTKLQGGQTISRPVDLETIPLYVKAGAIIPMGPVKQFTAEAAAEPITLRIYPGADGPGADGPGADGRFAWYDDDGVSYQHEHGEFIRVDCALKDTERTLTLSVDQTGHMPLPATIRVEIVGTNQAKLLNLKRGGVTVNL
jgi:alpha-glucosidase/alpha-D-xyloside xylohydrolase